MSNTAKQIIQLKDEIADLKERNAKYEGKKETLYSRLKKDFKITTLEQAEELKDKWGKKIKVMETKLVNLIEEFKENYEICD